MVAFGGNSFSHCGRAFFVSTYNLKSAPQLRRRASSPATPTGSPPTGSPGRHTGASRHRRGAGASSIARQQDERPIEAEQARQEQELLEAGQRQAELNKRRKMAQAQWPGGRPEPGDNPESHFARVAIEDVLGLDNTVNTCTCTDSFVYPDGHADAALRGTPGTRPGPRAIRLFVLSLDQDLAADLRANFFRIRRMGWWPTMRTS